MQAAPGSLLRQECRWRHAAGPRTRAGRRLHMRHHLGGSCQLLGSRSQRRMGARVAGGVLRGHQQQGARAGRGVWRSLGWRRERRRADVLRPGGEGVETGCKAGNSHACGLARQCWMRQAHHMMHQGAVPRGVRPLGQTGAETRSQCVGSWAAPLSPTLVGTALCCWRCSECGAPSRPPQSAGQSAARRPSRRRLAPTHHPVLLEGQPLAQQPPHCCPSSPGRDVWLWRRSQRC
jgi:hypothetical protein